MPLHLSVVTPLGTVVDQSVDGVVVPGQEGEFGVLPSHFRFLSALQAGVLEYHSQGKKEHVALSAGFVEATAERVTVLARTAERTEEIDRVRAEAALARAQETLRGTGAESLRDELATLEAAAARASARLRALGS